MMALLNLSERCSCVSVQGQLWVRDYKRPQETKRAKSKRKARHPSGRLSVCGVEILEQDLPCVHRT